MSLSTYALSSTVFCPCCSETHNSGPLQGWIHELRNKFILSTDSPADFLDKYVPSKVPYKPMGKIRVAFAKWTPEKGKEADGYPYLLAGFSALVALFPPSKRPSFIDSHSYTQRFPFAAFAHKHHDTHPDLSVSLPGVCLGAEDQPKFSELAMTMEARSKRNEDPFKKDGFIHCKSLVQLAVNARNLMHAHSLSCAFVFGIYGNHLRICRFDHSGAVVSQPIDLRDLEGVKIVQEFFWRFVHPIEDVQFVGCDPTVRKLTPADEVWLKARLNMANYKGTIAFTEARRAEVYDDVGSDVAVEPQAYLLFKAVDVNGRLFSRATTVWYGIRDTRISDRGRLVDPPARLLSAGDLKVRIIKDAWRQLVRHPENDFYRRFSVIPLHERIGLPSMVCGGDLGEKEVREWESALYDTPTPTLLTAAHHQSRLSAPTAPPGSVASPPPASLSASTGTLELPAHRPMQQTFIWRQARGAEYWHRERSHMRFVVGEVGRPITQFKSTKELATVFRDAIIGHRTAMRKGGILHRDISVGNILIVDDPEEQEEFCGFIHDFDYSSMSKDVPQGDISSLSATALTETLLANDDDDGPELKKRTGTFLFMSDELLAQRRGTAVVHDVRHDIHSFYWVLLWVVLRHTKHNNLSDSTTTEGNPVLDSCARVFKQGSMSDAAAAKRSWMWEFRHLVITGNGPLTTLLREFGMLLAKSSFLEELSLDYDVVLDIFDRALTRQDWPQSNDAPVRYTPSLPSLKPVNGWMFENVTPEKKSAHGKGKEVEATSYSGSGNDDDDEDEIDKAYIDEAYDSESDDDPQAVDGSRHSLLPSLQLSEMLRMRDDDDDDEWGDAAEVSAMIGHGDGDSDSDDGDLPMEDHGDSQSHLSSDDSDYHQLPSLLGRLKMARPKKTVTPAPTGSTVEPAAAGPSRVNSSKEGTGSGGGSQTGRHGSRRGL